MKDMKFRLMVLLMMGMLPMVIFSQGPMQKEYFENGDVKSTIVQDGESFEVTSYYENGQIKDQSTFLGTVRNGSFKSWYENGQPKLTASYSNNQRSGIWTIWNAEGEKIGFAVYENGSLLAGSMWNEEGKMMAHR